MTPLQIDGQSLALEDVEAVARQARPVGLAAAARPALAAAERLIAGIVAGGRPVYGVTTGFGALSVVSIPGEDLARLQLNLLRSHAAGVGPPFPEEVVRAMLLLRANTLARGHSGVRALLVERLLDLLNLGVHPVVPCQGSVGASGDLAPLAHLALVLLGEGRALLEGREQNGGAALAAAGLAPLVLGPKEGLALINGTQASAAVGTLALLDAERLLRAADAIGALSLEALQGRPSAFDPRIHALRPIPGQVTVADNLTRLLEGSRLVTRGQDALQDPYCLRCMPQVHGASRESARMARRILEIEINAVTDNPLLFPAEGDVLSGGNFHGEPLAQAMDALVIGLVSLAAISERRLDRLLDASSPGLPLFLTERPGLNSGLMMTQVTAAALLGESRVLAHPASVDSIPTSAGKEDHVSFSTHAARKAREVAINVARVLAAELLAACQALDLRDPTLASPHGQRVHAEVRSRVPPLDEDRALDGDLAALARMIGEGVLRAPA